ncbi:TPA: hypothetical protein OMF64_004407 [Klebsiella pneumoniae]|nr:hypothetical protein [Klebsiella pneumoniae]HCQ8703067.1 hypothetical protein [Klebsiella pneumoniae]
MSDKTKAALQSCQCHYQMFKQKQNTRLHAGGQSLSELQNSNSVLVGFSSNRGEVSKTYIRQWRTLDHTAKNYPDIGYHSLSASLAFLRWRRLISPRIEVTINCDVLSSLSLTSSIASTTSCGTLAFRACDFAFFVPVAITESPLYWWATVYTKKGDRKALTWATPCNYSGPHLDFVKVKNNEAPRVSLPLAELLTNNRYHGAKNG